MNARLKILISIPLLIIGLMSNFPPLDLIFCFVGGLFLGSGLVGLIISNNNLED